MSHFFVFEGCTGSGKSTQLEKLREQYPSAVFTFLPGGTVAGDALREVLFAQSETMSPIAQLYTVHATHWQNYVENIKPALESGNTVFCDRFQLSTYVYQVHEPSRQEDVMEHFLETAAQFLNEGLQPHYIFMDIAPVDALKRIAKRADNDPFDERDIEYHDRVYAGYKQGLVDLGLNYTVVNANQDLESVTADVKKAVTEVINTTE